MLICLLEMFPLLDLVRAHQKEFQPMVRRKQTLDGLSRLSLPIDSDSNSHSSAVSGEDFRSSPLSFGVQFRGLID